MEFKVSLWLAFLLFSTAQAINPFEGNVLRSKCLKGRTLKGCNETLLEAYEKSGLSESDHNFKNATSYMMLFTRNNKKNPEYLDDCGAGLPDNTKFNPKEETVIIVHGFVESICEVAWMLEMKVQLLYRDKYNVILIDYSWGNQFDYYDAVNNVKVVGKQIALMIHNIIKKSGSALTLQKFHLIGHSLGAQICGYAGQEVQRLLPGEKVRRISGLDPAGPAFQTPDPAKKLDPTDAHMVDIIHTNGGDCVPLYFGHFDPMGHADFYPNGGSKQDSCMSYTFESFLKGDIMYALPSLAPPLCYHKQSVQYFKVSINSCTCPFVGVICNSYEEFSSGKCEKACGTDGSNCAVMGMDWEYYPKKEGNNSYYLDTKLTCPYCDNTKIKLQGFKLSPPGKKASCFETLPSILSSSELNDSLPEDETSSRR